MVNFTESEIAQILPAYLRDSPEAQAISYAIHRQMERYAEYCRRIGGYAMIDGATDDILDMMALDLNTQYYDEALDIATKRKLIKGTLKWYIHSGTPSAVAELVAAVFGEGEVKEWFEYGDDPYYFKITTNATMTPEINDTFSAMIQRVKNARSHIRAIDIHRTLEQTIYPSVFGLSNYKPAAIIDGYKTEQEAAVTEYGIVAGQAVSRPAAVIDGFSVTGGEVPGVTYSGTATGTTQRPAAIMEQLTDTAEAVTQALYGGAAQASAQVRQAAIMENLTYTAEAAQQAIAAGTAADSSNYKSTINE